MNQSKSVYTRRFNQLKQQLQEQCDQVDFSDTASLRWGPESCIVAHDGSLGFTMWFQDELTGEFDQSVSIVKTPTCARSGLVGIHVREIDLHGILDCIDTALKDGFEHIYVTSIASLKGGAK